MAEIRLPELRANRSGSLEEELQNLKDAYFMLKKQLTFLMSGNLDEENVIRAGSVYAENIITTNAKIRAAQIETLSVGDNVTMGPNATISWSKVTGTPSIPSQYTNAMALAAWKNSDYATYIDADGVYSGSFNGGMFNVNPLSDPALESGITIGGWYNGAWAGQALQIKYDPCGDGSFPGTILSSSGDVPMVFDITANFDSYVRFRSSSDVDFQGSVDFTGATVTGLSGGGVYKFG